jgi:hypothetical protein
LCNHRRCGLIVFPRTCLFGLFRGEQLAATIAAQTFQLEYSRFQRRLSYNAHQCSGFLLAIYFATPAFRTGIPGLERLMRNWHFFRAGEHRGTVASVAFRLRLTAVGMCLLTTDGVLCLLEYSTGLLSGSPPHYHLRQRVQGRFELLTVGFTQRGTHATVNDPVQFL